eukprot:GHVR01164799.1.p1 GENE.GHVR01164799.1~~GHVR01164799.1.p1  ORF type:complete len:141 (+),score=27.15 GHVR01164799.1:103-525(+)
MQTQNVNVNVFVIIGKGDVPLFEVDLSGQGKRPDSPHLAQFVIHAALDIVDELVWYNNNMYLKQVDRFNDLLVSSWVTPGHIRFMLLHTQKNDEAIASFFKDVYELYVKLLANPFYEINGPICSSSFESRIHDIARKYLG